MYSHSCAIERLRRLLCKNMKERKRIKDRRDFFYTQKLKGHSKLYIGKERVNVSRIKQHDRTTIRLSVFFSQSLL